ncbi:hypothetical protein J1N35_013912, partial [Gossypium stocksii]
CHEEEKYQRMLDRLNKIESTSSRSNIYDGDTQFDKYPMNPTKNINYIENKGENPYSYTDNPD